MSDERRKKAIERLLRECIQKIAAERDTMRALIDDYSEIADDAEQAVDEIETALDTISQHL